MNNAKHDAGRISKILNIRATARRTTVEEMLRGPCCTCGRPAGDPYRVFDARGKVQQGCVDAHHTGALIGESARWHARPEAQAIRAAELRGIE